MKKNGFTLSETLGVVVLLGLIAVITIPILETSMDNSKQALYNDQISYIKSGLENWSNANIFMLPEVGDSATLTLGQLKQTGNAEYKIVNPKNNKCFSNESLVSIINNNGSYEYEITELVDVKCSLIENVPTININGNIIEYVYVGDIYTDLGATAKSSNKVDITSSITKTISGSGTTIDTTKEGNYMITYKVTNGGKTMTAIRNVYVRRKPNPILTSDHTCVKNTKIVCSDSEIKSDNGILVNVKVNDREDYDFYVIDDTGEELTLMMSENLGDRVSWYHAYDNSYGPIVALENLKERTSGWSNITPYSYTLVNDDDGYGGSYGYTEVTGDVVTDVRARMLTYTEAVNLGCTESNFDCPVWVYDNMNDTPGYWLSTAHSEKSIIAWLMFNDGNLVSYFDVIESWGGIRPVIKVLK